MYYANFFKILVHNLYLLFFPIPFNFIKGFFYSTEYYTGYQKDGFEKTTLFVVFYFLYGIFLIGTGYDVYQEADKHEKR
jgi:hypothetical protein